jgi:hypothetical protein
MKDISPEWRARSLRATRGKLPKISPKAVRSTAIADIKKIAPIASAINHEKNSFGTNRKAPVSS